MSANKHCFLDPERPCDLTCKAAFEVDDPVDNIDCYFIWLSYHFGETLFELKRVLENVGRSAGGLEPPGFGGKKPKPGGGPKGPKDFPSN